MIKDIQKKDGILHLDGNNFAQDIYNGCEIHNSALVRGTRWLIFNPSNMDKHIDQKINEIIEIIFYLRKQEKDEDAIDYSDAFFQSFTPLMNIFVEQENFSQVIKMWEWLILKVKIIEEFHGVEFGDGVHKGTAFYFLGLSKLMLEDVDGAFLSFAEAAKDDEILPQSVLNRHQKGIPPVVKILLLDLSKDNFAHNQVKQIRESIVNWEKEYSSISRSTSIFISMENAINKNLMPRDSAIHLCHAFTKAYVLDSWRRSIGRPTSLTISLLGDSILRFALTLEDFIGSFENFKSKKTTNKKIKLFDYCHDTWFASKKWNYPNYDNNIDALIDDFILNNKWELLKDERNLLFTVKIRNALAHRIPNDQKIFDNYIEIILAISSSIGFICDEISK